MDLIKRILIEEVTRQDWHRNFVVRGEYPGGEWFHFVDDDKEESFRILDGTLDVRFFVVSDSLVGHSSIKTCWLVLNDDCISPPIISLIAEYDNHLTGIQRVYSVRVIDPDRIHEKHKNYHRGIQEFMEGIMLEPPPSGIARAVVKDYLEACNWNPTFRVVWHLMFKIFVEDFSSDEWWSSAIMLTAMIQYSSQVRYALACLSECEMESEESHKFRLIKEQLESGLGELQVV